MRLLLSFVAWLAIAAITPASASEGAVNDPPGSRWVEVTGEGSVNVTPDFARVTLGVTTAGPEASDAMAANAKAANSLVSLIKSEGVPAADIQTSGISISPTFAQQSGGARAPAITGYTVSNTVNVVVRDIPRLGALLDKAASAGANAIYGIGFGEDDPGALLDKARPLAVADARRKAEIYAAAGGAKIGRLVTLSEEGSPRPIAYARASTMAAAPPTPVEPGQDKLTVTVTARFELTD
jgi:uncharacterized protein